MEMKQVERSSIQIPNRCVARVPPTAPWRQGTVTQPSGPARGHGCAPQIKVYFNLPYLIIYLGIPRYFCRLFLSLASTRAIYTYRIIYKFVFHCNSPRRVLLPVLCLSYRKKQKKKISWTNNEDRRRVIPVVSIVSYRISSGMTIHFPRHNLATRVHPLLCH